MSLKDIRKIIEEIREEIELIFFTILLYIVFLPLFYLIRRKCPYCGYKLWEFYIERKRYKVKTDPFNFKRIKCPKCKKIILLRLGSDSNCYLQRIKGD